MRKSMTFIISLVCVVLSATASGEERKRGALQRMLRPEMELPAELQSEVETLSGATIRGMRSPLSFGPYRVTRYSTEWDWGSGGWVLSTPISGERVEDERKFSYVLTDNGRDVWRCRCLSKWSSHDMHIAIAGIYANVKKDQESSIDCDLARPNENPEWTLHFGPAFDPKVTSETGYIGSLSGATAVYEIRDVKGAPGYIFIRAGAPVAAADSLQRGHLVLRNSLTAEEREVIAAAASALLLRVKPSGSSVMVQ